MSCVTVYIPHPCCVSVKTRSKELLSAVQAGITLKTHVVRGGGGGSDLIHVGPLFIQMAARARICKRLRSPGIDSKELILPSTSRAGTIILFVVRAQQAT
jgi:hypothetical protein